MPVGEEDQSRNPLHVPWIPSKVSSHLHLLAPQDPAHHRCHAQEVELGAPDLREQVVRGQQDDRIGEDCETCQTADLEGEEGPWLTVPPLFGESLQIAHPQAAGPAQALVLVAWAIVQGRVDHEVFVVLQTDLPTH